MGGCDQQGDRIENTGAPKYGRLENSPTLSGASNSPKASRTPRKSLLFVDPANLYTLRVTNTYNFNDLLSPYEVWSSSTSFRDPTVQARRLEIDPYALSLRGVYYYLLY